MAKKRTEEIDPIVVVGEVVGRGASLAVRVGPGEYVALPAHLLPEHIYEGDRIRVEVRVAVVRETPVEEEDNDSTPNT